jgi:hypothetical protein
MYIIRTNCVYVKISKVLFVRKQRFFAAIYQLAWLLQYREQSIDFLFRQSASLLREGLAGRGAEHKQGRYWRE